MNLSYAINKINLKPQQRQQNKNANIWDNVSDWVEDMCINKAHWGWSSEETKYTQEATICDQLSPKNKKWFDSL